MKNTFVVLLVASLALTGCGGGGATVHASATSLAASPNSNFNWPDCGQKFGPGSPEAFALGVARADGSVVDESAHHLEFNSPVYPALCVMTTSYTLQYSHTVEAVILHVGSGKDAELEWAVWVDFYLPDGTQRRTFMQFDKHTDYRGSMDEPIPVSWSLPAGTQVVIRRPAVNCIKDPDPPANYPGGGGMPDNACITGQKVVLVDK